MYASKHINMLDKVQKSESTMQTAEVNTFHTLRYVKIPASGIGMKKGIF